jgi:phosphopantetheine adenylyltransferase
MVSNDSVDLKKIVLSPQIQRVRDSIIKKFADEPLDIMAKFVKDVVDSEKDTVKRLGAMAARVEILRMRLLVISKGESALDIETTSEDIIEDELILEENNNEIVPPVPNLADWVRLRIIENSEINGVRFPKGVVIDVSKEDGDRLLESGKATSAEEDELVDIKSDLKLKKKTKTKDASVEPTVGSDDDVNSDKEDAQTEASDPSSYEVVESVDDKNGTTTKSNAKSELVVEDETQEPTVELDDEVNLAGNPIDDVDKKIKSKDEGVAETPSAEDMLSGFEIDNKDDKKNG